MLDAGFNDADLVVPLIFVSNFVWAMSNLAVLFVIRNIIGAHCFFPYRPTYVIKNQIVRDSLWWMQWLLLAVACHRMYMNFTAVVLLAPRDVIQGHYWFPLTCVGVWIFAAHRVLLSWAGVKANVLRAWVAGYLLFNSLLAWGIYEVFYHDV